MPQPPQPDALSEEIVQAIHGLFGEHRGHRAVHAKGILCEGSFTGTPAAARLCRAAQFSGEPVRAHVRFSNGGGDPSTPDSERDGRGLAIKLYLPDGTTTDIVSVTLPVFFVRTAEDFLEFTRVRRPDPETGELDLARVGAWLGEHPEAQAAVQHSLAAPAPASYAQLEYWAIHAFLWTGPDGLQRYARYRWIPEAGIASLEAEEAGSRAPDYLQQELRERLASGQVAFSLQVQIAEDGDPTDDATAAWPDERETVDVGRLEVTAEAFDRDTGDDVLVFDPTRVTDGIDCSGDAILLARPKAYAASVARRIAAR